MNSKLKMILIIITFLIFFVITAIFLNKIDMLNNLRKQNRNNMEFLKGNESITGAELISLINKAYSKNAKINKLESNIAKEQIGFKPDNKEVVIIEISINGNIVSMDKIIRSGAENFFVNLHNDFFKREKILYYENGNVSYILYSLNTK